LRKATIYELNGNTVTKVHITVSDCYERKLCNSEIIFPVSSSNLAAMDLIFEWKSFDTLTIKYNKALEVVKQKRISKSVNPKIIFEYITD